MSVYQIKNKKLTPVKEKEFDLEKDLQTLVEENLETLFGLEFVSTEFPIEGFFIDTLAYDPETKSFVILEYKRGKNFSVVDQGLHYLSLLLNNKANFVLEFNQKKNKRFRLEDIDWGQVRVLFLAQSFTNYQQGAINFRDFPIELWEVTQYEGGFIDFHQIEASKRAESITKITKDKSTAKITRQVRTYTVEDLVKPNWDNTKALLEELEEALLSTEIETRVKYTKFYIAYMSKHGRNYVEIVPQQRGLKVYFRFPFNHLRSSLKIKDCRTVGRLANGDSFILLTKAPQIPEVVRLSKESFKYLHRDVYNKNK